MSEHSNTIPFSIEAEKAVLSIIFQYPGDYVVKALAEGLTGEHFFGAATNIIWKEMILQHQEGHTIELVSFTESLRNKKLYDKMGGAAMTTEIYTYMPTAVHWTRHIEILRNRLARRRMLEFATKAEQGSYTDSSQEQLIAMTKEATEAIMQTTSTKDAFKSASQSCDEFIKDFEDLCNRGTMAGISTGLTDLDEKTGGMRSGELWVISGPTSGGKSVLCLQLSAAALKLKKKVGIMSLEMGAEENIARMISCQYGVDYQTLRNPLADGMPVKETLIKLKNGIEAFKGSPLKICDEAGLTIERIEALAQQLKDTEGLDVLVVDYIQLIRTSRQGEARHEELSMIAGTLKQLAKKLGCTVITGSQLNTEGRMAKAKSIGDDADVVLRIEEEGLYVLKNRNGEKHITLPLILDGRLQKFTPKHY